MFRSTRLLLCGVSATAVAFSSPAFAQQEQTQVEAQKTNDVIECSSITDPAQHQKCIETQGENAIPQGGAQAANAEGGNVSAAAHKRGVSKA